MKNIVKASLAAAGSVVLLIGTAAAGQDSEQALNASDTNKVMSVYARNSVFMPQNRPSQVGAKAIRNAYTGIFKAINLDIKFKLAEIRTIGPDWAFARSNSIGAITCSA